MHTRRAQARRRRSLVQRLFLAGLLVLSACQTTPPAPPPVEPEPELPTVVEPKPKPEAPKPAPPPPPPPVAILVSKNIPAYSRVADAVAEKLRSADDRPVQQFDTSSLTSDALASELAKQRVEQVVAIGDGAVSAIAEEDFDLIYAQTFDPPNNHRGVDALPPADIQFRYWTALHPKLKRIGVIGGAEFTSTMAEMVSAGEALELEVTSRIVTSDKQAWVEFRRILPNIDGFVFLPDRTILSPTGIQRMMQHGAKNDIQFLTYNALLYKLGAQLHITQNPDDVAEQLAHLVRNPQEKRRQLTSFKARQKGSEVFVDISG